MSDKLFDYGVECIRTRHKGVDIEEATVAIRHVIAVAKQRLTELTLPDEAGPLPTPRRVVEQLSAVSQQERQRRKEVRQKLVAIYRTQVKFGGRNVDELFMHELAAYANEHTFLGLFAIKLLKHARPNECVKVGDAVSKAAITKYEAEARKQAIALVSA